jgi:Cu-Zn family superoxide dismutase
LTNFIFNFLKHIAPLIPVFFLLGGCVSYFEKPTATAVIQSKSGSNIQGSLNFSQSGDIVLVSGYISGLKPNSAQGIHIHEKGDCTASDAMSAGGHYNPESTQHGRHDLPMHHAGDLPNIVSDANGNVRYLAKLKTISLIGDSSILGRALVIHRDADDYTSQPSGNSGPRIGCALIR